MQQTIKPKPQKETKSYYDFNKCRDYIKEKYRYNPDDYLGMFKGKKTNNNVEFLCFWHFITDTKDIHNGCFFNMAKEDLEYLDGKHEKNKEFLAKVYNDFFSEFSDGKDEIEFYVWW